VSGFLSSLNGTTIPMPCTVKNLYVRLNGTQPAGGSIVATLQKAATDTDLVVTIPSGSVAGGYSDSTHSITFTGGETLGIKIKNNSGSASAPITSAAVELQPATV
jgi:molybdopterin biosynthesis enzyme